MHVLARITFKPEAADRGLAILARLVTHTRREAGCVSYALYEQAEQPHVFQTVEEWRDAAAADAHMKTAHIAEAFAAAGPLLASPPEILSFKAVA